jgi:hypothetical protein
MDDETAMFLAAIERDPWAAIERTLPDNADIEALEAIRVIAWRCFEMGRDPDTPGSLARHDLEACARRIGAIDRRLTVLRAI